jgi:hypothetical protein
MKVMAVHSPHMTKLSEPPDLTRIKCSRTQVVTARFVPWRVTRFQIKNS